MDPNTNQATDQNQNPMPPADQPVQTPPASEPVVPAGPPVPATPVEPVSQPEMPTPNKDISGGDQMPPIPGV